MIGTAASLDRMFEALAEPTRRAMLERLSRGISGVLLDTESELE